MRPIAPIGYPPVWEQVHSIDTTVAQYYVSKWKIKLRIRDFNISVSC